MNQDSNMILSDALKIYLEEQKIFWNKFKSKLL